MNFHYTKEKDSAFNIICLHSLDGVKAPTLGTFIFNTVILYIISPQDFIVVAILLLCGVIVSYILPGETSLVLCGL